MASDHAKKFTLKSSEGEEFVVDEAVAKQSQTILHLIEDGCADGIIPLDNVNSKILNKIVEYCKKHVECAAGSSSDAVDGEKLPEKDLRSWDSEFVKVDRVMLFDIMLAANYLDIKGILDITSQAAADMIKDMTPEEVRKTLHITNDFTPEEEEEVRRNNQWAFE